MIRNYFSGNDSSDFYRYGDLCVSAICIGSEVALILLCALFKLPQQNSAVHGIGLFNLVHNGVLVIAVIALVARQVSSFADNSLATTDEKGLIDQMNNIMRILKVVGM